MITTYALLLNRCGLSHREAAAIHGVRLDTVKSWATGRNRAAAGAIAELRALFAQIENVANESAVQFGILQAAHGAPDAVDLALARDDQEAQALGWPCVGAHAAVIGTIAARATCPVNLVMREDLPAGARVSFFSPQRLTARMTSALFRPPVALGLRK